MAAEPSAPVAGHDSSASHSVTWSATARIRRGKAMTALPRICVKFWCISAEVKAM